MEPKHKRKLLLVVTARSGLNEYYFCHPSDKQNLWSLKIDNLFTYSL